MDHSKSFGERCSAFEFEHKTLRFKPPKAMHQPIIFFDQHGVDFALVGNNREQLIEIASFVQELSHVTTPEHVYAWPYFRNCLEPVEALQNQKSLACFALVAKRIRGLRAAHLNC